MFLYYSSVCRARGWPGPWPSFLTADPSGWFFICVVCLILPWSLQLALLIIRDTTLRAACMLDHTCNHSLPITLSPFWTNGHSLLHHSFTTSWTRLLPETIFRGTLPSHPGQGVFLSVCTSAPLRGPIGHLLTSFVGASKVCPPKCSGCKVSPPPPFTSFPVASCSFLLPPAPWCFACCAAPDKILRSLPAVSGAMAKVSDCDQEDLSLNLCPAMELSDWPWASHFLLGRRQTRH